MSAVSVCVAERSENTSQSIQCQLQKTTDSSSEVAGLDATSKLRDRIMHSIECTSIQQNCSSPVWRRSSQQTSNSSLVINSDDCEMGMEAISDPVVTIPRSKHEYQQSDSEIQDGPYGTKTPKQESDTESQILDLDSLLERCGGDMELVSSVLDSFFEQGSSRLQSLNEAVCAGDWDRLFFDAEFLRGSSQNVCATRVLDAVDALIEKLLLHRRLQADSSNKPPPFSDEPLALPGPSLHVATAGVADEFVGALQFWKSQIDPTKDDEAGSVGVTMDEADTLGSVQDLRSALHACEDPTQPAADWPGGHKAQRPPGQLSWEAERTTDGSAATEGTESDSDTEEAGGGAVGGGPAGGGMAAFLAKARANLDAIRRAVSLGDTAAALAAARATRELADAVGSRSVGAQARALEDKAAAGGLAEGLRSRDVDALEQKLEAADAIWRSCGITV